MSKKKNINWQDLKQWTTARIGLASQGHALSTQALLEFQRAHAAARSAVHWKWDLVELEKQLLSENDRPKICHSRAATQDIFLKFPEKGRTLCESSKEFLLNCQSSQQTETIAFIVSNGLSSLAIQNHFIEFWKVFKKLFSETFPELAYQLVLVPFGRVAISDDIGEALKARMSVIFIGERPGLNSPDSMGIYLTYNPTTGNSDADRNCISNVRVPFGLDYSIASQKLIYLLKESFRLQLSGVQLKEEFIIPAKLK